MSNLKPCPFCGSDDVETVDEIGSFYGYCGKCSACGPSADTEEEGERLWNEREGDDARLSIPDVMAINANRTKIYISHRGQTIEYTADQLPDGAAALLGIKKGNEDEQVQGLGC